MNNMVDKAEIKWRFRRSVDSYDENAHVQKRIVEHLAELAGEYYTAPHGRVLEIGCGTGLLTARMLQKWPERELTINDLVEEMCSRTAERCRLPEQCCLAGDIEHTELQGVFDLIISASTFQWLATPRETFARLATHLRPGGWLIFSSFGEENFKELKAVTGQGLRYRSLQETEQMLAPHCDRVYAEEDRHVLLFDDPVDVLRHVKKTGVNASSSSSAWTRGRLQEFSKAYTCRFLQEGQCPLTYHPVYYVGRKREVMSY